MPNRGFILTFLPKLTVESGVHCAEKYRVLVAQIQDDHIQCVGNLGGREKLNPLLNLLLNSHPAAVVKRRKDQ
jgi:hypothetical protein